MGWIYTIVNYSYIQVKAAISNSGLQVTEADSFEGLYAFILTADFIVSIASPSKPYYYYYITTF